MLDRVGTDLLLARRCQARRAGQGFQRQPFQRIDAVRTDTVGGTQKDQLLVDEVGLEESRGDDTGPALL